MSDHDPLRDELARLARPPTDTTGVADTVLARIATTPPGGGGGGGAGAGPWVAATGVAATLALVAGIGLGVRSDDGGSTVATEDVTAAVVGGADVALLDCPDGSPVGDLSGGDRVLVVAQADDGAWVAVRRPTDLGAEAWVDADLVVPDGDLAGVPEGGCDDHGQLALVAPDGVTQTSLLGPPPDPADPADEPEEPDEASGPDELAGPPTTTGPAPTAAPGPTPPGPTPPGPTPPGPTTTVAPQPTTTTPPPDTTGPSIQNAAASPGAIYDTGCGPTSSSIAAYVTDPSGVASVTASWKVGAKPKVTKAMGGGSTRTTTFTTGGAVPWDWNQQPVTVTITARDGAGNQSTAQVVVRVTYCFA